LTCKGWTLELTAGGLNSSFPIVPNLRNTLDMDHSDLEEHHVTSWHPALRPNDDEQRGSRPIQPSPPAIHGVDSHSANPNLDVTRSTASNKQHQGIFNTDDDGPEDVYCALNIGPHEFDALDSEIAQPASSQEYGAQSSQQPVHIDNSTQGQSPSEGGFGVRGNVMSVHETSGLNDGSTDGLRLSPIEGTKEKIAQEAKSEISSDEDDERLDPAGGISRSGIQQFPIQIDRSSSFPALPLELDLNNGDAIDHLHETQAEAIMTESGTHIAPNNDMRRLDELSEQANPWNSTSNGALFEGQEDSFFEQMASTNQTIDKPTNAEARFEEGMPLIDSESRPNDETEKSQSRVQFADNQIWSPSVDENAATFVDRPTSMTVGDATKPLPVKLDRKATSDVFSSLNFSSDQALDSPREAADEVDSLTSSQQHQAGQNQEKALRGDAIAGADISVLWEAVLDDDDFLAEDSDGLLPDSSPGSTPGSPPSFLESLNGGTKFQEPDEVLSKFDSHSSIGGPISAKADEARQFTSRQMSNPYTPHQPSSSDRAQMSPTTYGNVGLSRPNLAPLSFGQNSFQGQLQRPPAPAKAESFVDQSKGGYKSPYDLPMDLSKPRKRIQMHQPPPASKGPAPPPRSSSMTLDQRPDSSAGPLQSPFSPANATFETQARPPSSQYSAPLSSVNRRVSNEQPNASKAKASRPSFFEELPITAKSRPPAAQRRYIPAQSGAAQPDVSPASPAAAQLQPATQMPPPPVPTKQPSIDSYSQYQLQRPERLDPYANVPLQASAAALVPTTRYSPAPPTSQTGPPPSRYSPAPVSSQIAPPSSAPSRYSPAPPPQPNVTQSQNRYASQSQPSPQLSPFNVIPQSRYPSQPVPQAANVMPFQPRTSSPLAYHGMKSDPQQDDSHRVSDITPSSPPRRLPPPQHLTSQREPPPASAPPGSSQDFAPLRRSQTQSPGKRGPVSSLQATSSDIMQRPASVHGPSSPTSSANAYHSFPPARPSVRQRGLSQHLNFISPTDETQDDELQRWRGSPIFRFGFGGSVLRSFPKHIPRYAAGSAMPMIKPMAGEVQLRNEKETFPIPEHVAKFPGPLRSKSKKKEVLAWLSDRIVALEGMALPSFSQQLPDPIKRHDERVLLWKVVKVIVEYDGAVDGNAEVIKAMNLVLSPESTGSDDLPFMHNAVASDTAGIYQPAGTISKTETIDPAAVESIRNGLLRGEREKAVWTAVDKRLWAHAMLLSSTLDKSVWKQVAHEFVRQEIKIIGANTESLAALYEIFAGNLEESIDELVSPSARAGLQMVSKVDGAGPTKSAIDGLDRWRETLGLVLNNRSPEDQKALAALGRLLSSYGRMEASHICHLFSSSPMLPSVFGGADDPQASIVLLGADHRNNPNEFFLDEDAALLTEVYEFASSTLASNSKSALMPHLQVYKLQRVKSLAEAGFKTEAQAYCDAIGASLRSTTKLSPYFHPQFLAELDDLTQRLSQAPTGTSSWISKPTMGKVSDSMWSKFTTFVAGDESDAASTGSGRDAVEFGPFAKVSGTPTVSRSGSSSDLYGSYASAAPQSVPNTIAGSRYAPSGQYSARSSSELTRGRPSLDSQRSPSYMQQGSIQRSPYDPNATINQQSYMSPAIPSQSASPYAPLGASPPVQPHQTTPPQTSYMPTVHPEGQMSPYNPRQPESYVPSPPPDQSGPYIETLPSSAPALHFDPDPTQAPVSHTYPPAEVMPEAAPPQTTPNYAPPLQSYSSYEPPSSEYIPYQPDPSSDSESESRKPKKKSFMADDDGFAPSTLDAPSQIAADTKEAAAAAAAARKKANDEAAEAAFRAAAEADAAKDKPSTQQDKTLKAKPSWFGTLFARKESDLLDAGGSKSSGGGGGGGEGQKVYRAKLGEESSFFYDKELKKWVNKKDPGGMQQAAKAAPPPPKGPVGRVVSESLGNAPAGGPPRSGLAAPPPSLSSSRPTSSNGPPSRAGTPGELGGGAGIVLPASIMSATGEQTMPAPHTSTPFGGPEPGPAPSAAPPMIRPYSTASDIDDLLGGPPTAGGRKTGGTLKGKKARGRYVDVMAK